MALDRSPELCKFISHFFNNQHALKESCKGSFLQNDLENDQTLSEKKIFNFYNIKRGKTAPPWQLHFSTNQHDLKSQLKGLENGLESSQILSEKKILKFYERHLRQKKRQTKRRPNFSTYQHGLKESDRGSPKDHFYRTIRKSDTYSLRR